MIALARRLQKEHKIQGSNVSLFIYLFFCLFLKDSSLSAHLLNVQISNTTKMKTAIPCSKIVAWGDPTATHRPDVQFSDEEEEVQAQKTKKPSKCVADKSPQVKKRVLPKKKKAPTVKPGKEEVSGSEDEEVIDEVPLAENMEDEAQIPSQVSLDLSDLNIGEGEKTPTGQKEQIKKTPTKVINKGGHPAAKNPVESKELQSEGNFFLEV